jgi:hypothetical protein
MHWPTGPVQKPDSAFIRGALTMTLAELALHLTREEMVAFGMWPDPYEVDEPASDDYRRCEEIS